MTNSPNSTDPPEAPQHQCEVCGETETDPSLLSDCSACGALYHLNPRSDREGKDCGDVRMGSQEVPAIQFFCNPCLERFAAEAAGFTAGADAPELLLDPLAAPSLGAGRPTGAAPASSDDRDAAAPSREGSGSEDPPATDAPPARRERPRRRFRRVDPS